ncbi:CU044_5270 family protein [Kribbella sp. NPDC049227]|uniref:CU044_5270 family protein n=1 Tax=Kribbella sp. NPDC049227 TaxID=3364113 RepID=UPI0037119FF0
MKFTDEAIDTAIHTYYDATPEPTAQKLAAVRQRVVGSRPSAVRRRRRLVVVPSLGVAAVGILVIALGAYMLPGGAPSDPGADPGTGTVPGAVTPAGAELNLVAARTDRAQPLAMTDQQVVYTRTKEHTVNSVPGASGEALYSATRLTESWAFANGLQVERIDQTSGLDARPLTKADEARLTAYGSDYRTVRTGPLSVEKGPAAGPAGGNWTHPTKEYLISLPTDPTTLLALLRSEIVKSYGDPGAKSSKPSTDQRTFQAVVDLVSRSDALLTPAVRSALYRAIGQMPGVVRSPGQVDLNGRTGIAFTHPMQNGLSVQLIISPDTTRALGVREVAMAPVQVNGRDPLPTGTVLSWSSTEQYVVASVGASP